MIIGNINAKASVSGNVPGAKGECGNGIKSTTLNDDYTLTLNYTNGTSETTSSIRGAKGEKGNDGISPIITTSKSGKVTTLTIKDATGTKTALINDGIDSQGDMLKSTYDKNKNGIVDNSEKVNGHTVNSDVPSNAKFTDTIYTHPVTSGNKHIPAGGKSGQILKWSEDGMAKWDNSIEAFDEGTKLKLNNNKEVIKLSVDGKTEQKTYAGKNILDYVSNLKASSNGLTNVINDDGSITTTGKPTSNYTTITKGVDLIDLLEDGETYTISQEKNNTNIYIQITARKKDGTNTYYGTANTQKKAPIKVDKTIYSNYYCSIQSNSTANWGDSSLTITNKYMLCKGTYTADSSYEPYVGGQSSPNPDYPQEIENVKGVENLFYNVVTSSKPSGITLTQNDDGSFILNGTTTGVSIFDFKLPKTLPAGTYTFSIESSDNISNDVFLRARDNNGQMVITDAQVQGNNTTQNSHTFTCEKEIVKVALNITTTGKTFNNFVIKPMLSKKKSNYVPYGSNYLQLKNTTDNESKIINIDLKGNELCSDKEQTLKDELIIENGRAKIIKKYDEVILDGTEDWVYDSTYKYFRCPTFDFGTQIPVFNANQLSNYFNITTSWVTFRDNINQNLLFSIQNISYKICIRDVSCTTAEQFKSWLKSLYDAGTPVKVQYQLAEPKVIDLGEVDLDLLENSTLTCDEEPNMQIDYLTIDSNIFVQDSLDGNSSQKAPSVKVVNNIINQLEARIKALESK